MKNYKNIKNTKKISWEQRVLLKKNDLVIAAYGIREKRDYFSDARSDKNI